MERLWFVKVVEIKKNVNKELIKKVFTNISYYKTCFVNVAS